MSYIQADLKSLFDRRADKIQRMLVVLVVCKRLNIPANIASIPYGLAEYALDESGQRLAAQIIELSRT